MTGGVAIGFSDLDLRQEPTVVWEAATEGYVLGVAEDRIVLRGRDGLEASTVFGVDLQTGAQAWQTPPIDGECTVAGQIVCVEQPGAQEATVALVDPADGSVQRRSQPGAVAAAPTGGDLVIASSVGSSHELVRLTPDGTVVWQTPVAATGAEFAQTVWFHEDAVSVAGLRFDLSTGTVTNHLWRPTPDSWIEQTRTGTVLTPPQGSTPLLDGEIVATFDDALGGATAITIDEATAAITAYDRSSGRLLWEIDGPPTTAQIRSRGILMLSGADDGTAAGIRVATGETVWSSAATLGSVQAASADTAVLVDVFGLTAVDIATGAQRWQFRSPNSSVVRPLDDGLLLLSDASLTRLRWP